MTSDKFIKSKTSQKRQGRKLLISLVSGQIVCFEKDDSNWKRNFFVLITVKSRVGTEQKIRIYLFLALILRKETTWFKNRNIVLPKENLETSEMLLQKYESLIKTNNK